MKKFLALALAFCMIATSMVFVPMTVAAEDASSTIYISAEGNDENAGTESAPVATLNKAISLAKSGDTIEVVGTIKYHTGENESGHSVVGSSNGKTLTVTGGEIDFTNIKHLSLKEDITFDNITLTFTDSKYLFAWGNDVTINENVTVNGKINVYAGGFQSSTGGTNITLLAGNYASIYGASHEAKYIINGDTNITLGGNVTADVVYGGSSVVNGDTHVTVGGSADVKTICGAGGTVNGDTYVVVKDNANPNSNPSDNSHNGGGYYIYGNGNGNVTGSTHVYFMDNAKAGYVVGGTSSTSGSVGGTANVYIMGGKTYSVYGCGVEVAADSNISANIVMTGGEVWQVFGGAESTGGDSSSKIDGNITIKLLGGTVWRRVFGGSYNEVSLFGRWSNSHYVNGTITLVIGEKVTLKLNDGSDYGLSAQSRRNGVASDENGVVIYANSTVKNNTKMDNGSANGDTHQTAHVYSYALNGNVITQTCSEHSSHSATATITPAGNTYTGEAIGISVAYSDNWEFEKFDITYANNKNAGTATATLAIEGITTFTYNYEIAKLSKKAPSVKALNNMIKGLTTEMEYSTDGVSYVAVTDANMTFDAGVYFVRYAGTENCEKSNAVKVFFGNGISANKVFARPGDTVEIIVNMPSNSGIDTLELAIGFDGTALKLETVAAGSVVDFEFDEETNTITWSGASTTKTGVLAKLTFTVAEGAAIGADYEIALSQGGFSIVNGSINVVEAISGDAGNDGKIDISDVIILRNAFVKDEFDALPAGADVNGDGTVDAHDILVLRQYIVNYDYDTGEAGVVLGGSAE